MSLYLCYILSLPHHSYFFSFFLPLGAQCPARNGYEAPRLEQASGDVSLSAWNSRSSYFTFLIDNDVIDVDGHYRVLTSGIEFDVAFCRFDSLVPEFKCRLCCSVKAMRESFFPVFTHFCANSTLSLLFPSSSRCGVLFLL